MSGKYVEEMVKKYSSTIKEKIQRNEGIAQEFEDEGDLACAEHMRELNRRAKATLELIYKNTGCYS